MTVSVINGQIPVQHVGHCKMRTGLTRLLPQESSLFVVGIVVTRESHLQHPMVAFPLTSADPTLCHSLAVRDVAPGRSPCEGHCWLFPWLLLHLSSCPPSPASHEVGVARHAVEDAVLVLQQDAGRVVLLDDTLVHHKDPASIHAHEHTCR